MSVIPEVCGMPIVGMLIDRDIPVGALVVVKVLDENGVAGYLCRATDGVTTVEALGMAAYADATLRQVFTRDEDG